MNHGTTEATSQAIGHRGAEDASPPARIQRKRARGWKKPDNTVCVTRGSCWGNPFIVDCTVEPGTTKQFSSYIAVPTAEDAVACYRGYLDASPDLKERARRNLRGKNLACWCDLDQPCHGNVLLEVANELVTMPAHG